MYTVLARVILVSVALAMPTKTVLSVLGVWVLSGLGNAAINNVIGSGFFLKIWKVIGRLVQINQMDTVCISIHQEQVHIAHGDGLFLKSGTWDYYVMVTDKYWDPTYVFIKVTLEHVYLFILFYYEYVFICLHYVYIVSNWLTFYCHLLR